MQQQGEYTPKKQDFDSFKYNLFINVDCVLVLRISTVKGQSSED